MFYSDCFVHKNVVKGEDKAMKETGEKRFDSASLGVCDSVRKHLLALPSEIKNRAQEIRLRVGRPVTLCCPEGIYFLKNGGGIACTAGPNCVITGKNEVEESFRILCGNSIYSHDTEIRNGYVTLRGGHRAGICGTSVFQNGTVSGLRDISSINIRIAHEVPGCANAILGELKNSLNGGLLLAGPPSSGKTTILRDIARQLSSGFYGNIYKVAVVDERGEIAGTYRGVPQNDIGICCDVLDCCPKTEGILTAIRTLSPQFIICDEIGTEEEVRAVEQSLNAGVSVIASIHAGTKEELISRRQVASLLKTGAFQNVVLLRGSGKPGEISEICMAGELLHEVGGSVAANSRGISRGIYGIA
ncbi:MAG: AAA domain-containing protein [Thermocaproicibacter melissae]|jgi:stage III sporulation protein AA|uniref:stage III sporulation protein AA n=1 Tax=Thermocaproicibacter melissae TaxID=2966552 RepID=UPI003A102B3C